MQVVRRFPSKDQLATSTEDPGSGECEFQGGRVAFVVWIAELGIAAGVEDVSGMDDRLDGVRGCPVATP
jgi:hypothetical protein